MKKLESVVNIEQGWSREVLGKFFSYFLGSV